jgi:DNA repair protein RecO (recombination protein O)
MRERQYQVQAIVLKRTDFGEADRLLTLFTPDRGKLRVLAKGARKPLSRKSGHVELFTHVDLMLAKGHQLDIVTQADTRESFIALRNNLERLSYAYYLAELVDRFAEEGTENRALYDLLLGALAWVADEKSNAALLARYFELHLLLHVGYRPQLITCLICDKPVEPIDNYFSVQAGGVLDPDCALPQRANPAGHASDAQVISLTALKVLRYLQTRDWQAVRVLTLDAKVMSEVEMLMERYIAYHLERNLKSVEFLQDLKRAPYRPTTTQRATE